MIVEVGRDISFGARHGVHFRPYQLRLMMSGASSAFAEAACARSLRRLGLGYGQSNPDLNIRMGVADGELPSLAEVASWIVDEIGRHEDLAVFASLELRSGDEVVRLKPAPKAAPRAELVS